MVLTTPQFVFVAYLLVVLGVGVYAARFTELTPADFYVADRGVGTIVLLMTIVATIMSSFTIFGLASFSVGTGLGVFSFLMLAQISYAVVFGTVGVSLYSVGKRLGVLTPSEYVRERYDSPMLATVYLAVCSVFMIGYVAGQLIGGGVALETIADIPFVWGIVGMGTFMILYTHIAGYRGVVWSDTLQSIMIAGIIFLTFVLVLATFGGDALAEGAMDATAGIFTNAGPFDTWTPLYVITFALGFALALPGFPPIIQRYFSADSAGTMRKAGVLYVVVALPVYLFVVALGVWALGLISVPENTDYVIALLIEEHMHPVLFGLAIASAIAAIMSTSDSFALTMGSMVSRDVYAEFLNPDAGDRREVRVTQAALVAVILLAMGVAWAQPAGIFTVIALSSFGFAVTTPPIFLGVYWDRATKEAGYASLIAGPAVLFLFFTEVIPPAYTYGMHYGFIGVVAAYLIFVAVSLLTSPSVEDSTDYRYALWSGGESRSD